MSSGTRSPRTAGQDTPTHESRQLPGLACEDCRLRKLRCDRVRPTCGSCKNLGITCNAITRQPRGPQRGHLKALQSRILALEQKLSEKNNQRSSPAASPSSVSPEQHPDQKSDEPHSDGQLDTSQPIIVEPSLPQPLNALEMAYSEELSISNSLPPFGMAFSTYPFPSHGDMLDQISPVGNAPVMIGLPAPTPDFGSCQLGTYSSPVPFKAAASGWNAGPQLDHSPRSSSGSVFQLSDLTKADLNHLYFDRVHLFIPMLNKRRYFTWATRSANVAPSCVCLQYAMWALAAGLGSQFKDIQNNIYCQTRAKLESLELEMAGESLSIEQAQAWILLAMYEIVQVNHHRGWLSAGRAFRIVLLMKLHEIDAPYGPTQYNLSYIEIEERRRTLWVAYSLDRILNLINQMPLTLNDQVILTRLPAPEAAFQSGRSVKSNFLSEGMGQCDEAGLHSPFTMSIVLATISGRCLTHQQQCTVEAVHGNTTQSQFARYEWLSSILSAKTKTVLDEGVDEFEESEQPMSLFNKMVAHASTLLLAKSVGLEPRNIEEGTLDDREQNALRAAQKIAEFSQRLAELSYFKVRSGLKAKHDGSTLIWNLDGEVPNRFALLSCLSRYLTLQVPDTTHVLTLYDVQRAPYEHEITISAAQPAVLDDNKHRARHQRYKPRPSEATPIQALSTEMRRGHTWKLFSDAHDAFIYASPSSFLSRSQRNVTEMSRRDTELEEPAKKFDVGLGVDVHSRQQSAPGKLDHWIVGPHQRKQTQPGAEISPAEAARPAIPNQSQLRQQQPEQKTPEQNTSTASTRHARNPFTTATPSPKPASEHTDEEASRSTNLENRQLRLDLRARELSGEQMADLQRDCDQSEIAHRQDEAVDRNVEGEGVISEGGQEVGSSSLLEVPTRFKRDADGTLGLSIGKLGVVNVDESRIMPETLNFTHTRPTRSAKLPARVCKVLDALDAHLKNVYAKYQQLRLPVKSTMMRRGKADLIFRNSGWFTRRGEFKDNSPFVKDFTPVELGITQLEFDYQRRD
nr:asperfuranone cluster transcription factor afoa [Quercus suber]